MISRGEIAARVHRAELNGPDLAQTYSDDSGRKWFKYAVDYTSDGRTFSTHVWALDFIDAERRLMDLQTTGRVAGQTYSEGDAS